MELKHTQQLDNKLYMGMEMRTSIQLLACSSLELLEYIQNEVENNPAIDSDQLVCDLGQNLDDIDCYSGTTRNDPEALEKSRDYQMQTLTSPVTMYEYLEEQLEETGVNEPIRTTALWIINSLNQDGYFLDEDLLPSDLRPWCPEALRLVQKLHPPGIAARDLKESLLIQAEQRGLTDPVLHQIIREDLDLLADRKFDLINRKYHISDSSRFLDLIRSLNPRPASAIPDYEPPQYITVDVYFETAERAVTPRLNDRYIPNLKIHPAYPSLVGQLDEAARGTYANYMNRVNFLNQSIHKRNNTLLSVCRAIIDRQSAFFDGTSNYLGPLTLNDIAQDIGLHISTVSRAVRSKYISYN